MNKRRPILPDSIDWSFFILGLLTGNAIGWITGFYLFCKCYQ